MGRTKQCRPEKSLYCIDYTHPSLALWFFGQNPPKGKNNNSQLNSERLIKEKRPVKSVVNGTSGLSHQQSNTKDITELAFDSHTDNETKPVHPLSQYKDFPPLNDIQLYITEAILQEEGSSCSFEKIYDYVFQRWRNIKRKDGTNYTIDCRRAVQANLKYNYNHMALFRQDKSREGYWTVCQSLEEAGLVMRERQSRREAHKSDSHDDNSDEDYVPAHTHREEANNAQTSPRDTHIEQPSPSSSEQRDSPKLNELQALVCECINDNGGSCHFDLIVHHVSKHWNTIQPKLGNMDVKTAVVNTLTDSNRNFKRDLKRTGWWMINVDPKPSKPENTSNAVPKSSKPLKRARKEPEQQPQQQYQPQQDTDDDPQSDHEDPSTKQLTELQILIMQAIDAEGGQATFDQIYEHVVKRFEYIRRRDGTPYTSDCKKAISSSLSNNSSLPFFKKENRKGSFIWLLTKKSFDFLVEYHKPMGYNPLKLEKSTSPETRTSPHSSTTITSPINDVPTLSIKLEPKTVANPHLSNGNSVTSTNVNPAVPSVTTISFSNNNNNNNNSNNGVSNYPNGTHTNGNHSNGQQAVTNNGTASVFHNGPGTWMHVTPSNGLVPNLTGTNNSSPNGESSHKSEVLSDYNNAHKIEKNGDTHKNGTNGHVSFPVAVPSTDDNSYSDDDSEEIRDDVEYEDDKNDTMDVLKKDSDDASKVNGNDSKQFGRSKRSRKIKETKTRNTEDTDKDKGTQIKKRRK